MNLLLLSNSRMPDGRYLTHALDAFADIAAGCQRAVFLPFAGVTIGWDDYTHNVRQALASLGLDIIGAHTLPDPKQAVRDADIIFVGGGNTFRLLAECRSRGWLQAISGAVRQGLPYAGWSAGSVLACPSIRTTNDMPIIDPKGFDALNLVPFQLNCHYTDFMPPGHQGETRRQRLTELTTLTPQTRVIGLPEGDWLRIKGQSMTLHGPHPAWDFQHGCEPASLAPGLLSLGA
jgi:dipeptidase E